MIINNEVDKSHFLEFYGELHKITVGNAITAVSVWLKSSLQLSDCFTYFFHSVSFSSADFSYCIHTFT